MERFMKCDFIISDVAISGYFSAKAGKTVHTNRQKHGLSINLGREKDYVFDDGYTVTLGQNEIIYLPKGASYSVQSEYPRECYFMDFDICNGEEFKPFSFKTKNTARYIKEFETATALHNGKKTGFQMQEKASLYRILSLMQTEYESKYISTATKKIIEPALEYIHENYRQSGIKISYLASLCSVSEDYLRKIFRNTFGISPIKYINQLKMSYAKELISSGMYTVTEAAVIAGYADISYFSREFKKYFDTSPAEYKK